jgi:uncharacterized protein (DUF1800 family)
MAQLAGSPIAVFRGPFTERHATRLLWRAGFGPKPGQARKLAAVGLDAAIASLTRPSGPARLIGKPPHGRNGAPLDPLNVWGDDHCWWLDRMVRSNHQLVERMTLVWHSWFATSIEASDAALMLRQNAMMRAEALGNFHQLLLNVTSDPAMLLWLSGTSNTKYSPNENYAREVMELFTLGADRGAYSQHDVRAQARALTGFANDWPNSGPTNFRFDPTLHDDGVKRIFGHRGRFDWRDTCRLCVEHPLHPSFFVRKLWSYFVGTPVPPGVGRALERVYTSGGHQVRPLVEAILRHPLFYVGPRMVTPPVVYCAGMLRALGRTVETNDWAWICQQAGQLLFAPPNVAGWDYRHWLDTSRWAARFTAVNYALQDATIDTSSNAYPANETPAQAVHAALRHWNHPPVSARTHASLMAFSHRVQRSITADWEQVSYRILRQNALRALIPTSPEWQTC